jgi:hypothetical protein
MYKNHLNFRKEQEAAFISGKAKAGHGWSEFRSGKNILKANPLKPAEKLQRINIAQEETIRLFLVRMVDGHVVKKHFHKTRDEVGGQQEEESLFRKQRFNERRTEL